MAKRLVAVLLALSLIPGPGFLQKKVEAGTIRPARLELGLNRKEVNGPDKALAPNSPDSLKLPQGPLASGRTSSVPGIPDGTLQNVRSPLPQDTSAQPTAKNLLPSAKAAELLSDMARNLSASGMAKPGENQEQELRSTFDGEKKAEQQANEPAQAQAGEAETFSTGSQQRASDPGRDPSHLELWRTMEQGLFKVLGARNLTSRAEAWRNETAKILGSDPSLPMEAALLKAFSKVQMLSPAQSKALSRSQVLSRLLYGKAEIIKGLPQTKRVVRVGDVLYALTDKGLYVKDPKGWRKVFRKGWGVLDLAEYRDKLHIVANSHLGGEVIYVRNRSSWKVEAFSTPVTSILAVHDTLYVGTHHGVIRLPDYEVILEKELPQSLAELDGEIYAGTPRGLYVIKPRPRRLLPYGVHSLNRIGKKLFAATKNGLYVFEGGKRSGPEPGLEDVLVYHATQAGQTLYAGTSDGVYRKGKMGWQRLPWYNGRTPYSASPVYHIHEDPDGTAYLSTNSGLAVIRPSECLAERVEEDLKGLIQEIGRSLALREEKSYESPEKPDGGTGGSVLETDDGRSLFSGLARRAHLLLVAAVAWMLFAASSLAHLIGNMPLGHSEAPSDLWLKLEGVLTSQLGLNIKESRADEWKRETLRVFKENPGKLLEEVLAETFGVVYQLPRESIQRTASWLQDLPSLLKGKLLKVFGDGTPVRTILAAQGKLLAGTNKGLYILDASGALLGSKLHRPKTYYSGEEGDRYSIPAYVDYLTEFGGEIYYRVMSDKIYRYSPESGKARKVTHHIYSFLACGLLAYFRAIQNGPVFDKFFNIAVIAVTWWLGTSFTFINDMAVFQNKLFVATSGGVRVFEKKSWLRRLFEILTLRWSPLRRVGFLPHTAKLAVINGKLYAVTRKGFFAREGRRWKKVLKDLPGACGLWFAGNQIYAVAEASPKQAGPHYGPPEQAIYRYDQGSWKEELYLRSGGICEISELNGKVYAVTGKEGLYIRENGQWRHAPWDVGTITLGAMGDALLLGTNHEGLLKVPEQDVSFLTDNWKDRLLSDVGNTLDQESAEKSLSLLNEEIEKSILKGPDGRELFSGWQGRP